MDKKDLEFEMRVSIGEGTRRLPVYLLLDCSGSMAGDPIEAVRRGVERFVDDVKDDIFARQTVAVGVITFDSDARMVTDGLLPIGQFQEEFQPDTLTASGSTSLGKALQVLARSLDADVKPNVPGKEKGDWKPLVFILTDGRPTDEWETPRQKILERQEGKVLNVITVGCGSGIDRETLKAIAIGPTFYMEEATSESFQTFFNWVTQSVRMASKAMSQPSSGDDQPVELPPPPNDVIQYIP